MSTDWGLRCLDHSITSNIDYRTGPLREIAAAGPALRSLHAVAPDIDVTHWSEFPLGFLREHGNCRFELINEYGEVEPLDKACDQEHGILPIACTRQDSHYGDHEAVWRVKDGPHSIAQSNRLKWTGRVPEALRAQVVSELSTPVSVGEVA